MATTRNKRVPMQEQIKLINECRRSGLTDADWCRENGIAPSTFYNWISRCRKASADIREPNYGHLEIPQPTQDVVSVDIVPEKLPEPSASFRQQTPLNLDNSHTIEVAINDITIRISNNADPILLSQTIKFLRMLPC
ncbi:MAG: helix-turn-helix domain-containing protein [Erysipelotrichaceae bacterium]|nr:helix-turn-helix domain-containing protein [Erysipelotrichaceae bacterium]